MIVSKNPIFLSQICHRPEPDLRDSRAIHEPSGRFPKSKLMTTVGPRLTAEQIEKLFQPIFVRLIAHLEAASGGDSKLLWALRRKLAKELIYLERGTPIRRKKLKQQKFIEQKGVCAICGRELPERGAELDRADAFLGYTPQNTRLVHHECHVADQQKKNYA
jgi:hypothetical protein